MELKSYLSQNKMSHAAFSRLIGATPNAVGLWVAGKRKPKDLFLERIRQATEGAVTANDFYHVGAE